MSEILVIGDDLTGTNATASAYARDGLRAVTMLDPTAPVDLDDCVFNWLSSHDTRTRRTDRGCNRQELWVRRPGHRETV